MQQIDQMYALVQKITPCRIHERDPAHSYLNFREGDLQNSSGVYWSRPKQSQDIFFSCLSSLFTFTSK